MLSAETNIGWKKSCYQHSIRYAVGRTRNYGLLSLCSPTCTFAHRSELHFLRVLRKAVPNLDMHRTVWLEHVVGVMRGLPSNEH